MTYRGCTIAAAKGNNYTLKRKKNPQHTKQQIIAIIDKLYNWAYEEDGLFLASFTWENYKKTPCWLHNLSDHHPEIKEALIETKALLAAKVAKHSWIGDRNSTFGERILPMYSKEYKEETKRKADLSKQSQSEIQATADEIIKAIKDDKLLELLQQKD